MISVVLYFSKLKSNFGLIIPGCVGKTGKCMGIFYSNRLDTLIKLEESSFHLTKGNKFYFNKTCLYSCYL